VTRHRNWVTELVDYASLMALRANPPCGAGQAWRMARQICRDSVVWPTTRSPARKCWFGLLSIAMTMEAFMRTSLWLGIIALLAVPAVCAAADEPITSNPIPEPIVKRGIAVEVKDVARLPDTHLLRPATP